MHPTIRDVAKRLNLSITTVSRALDGYEDVADNTRKLIVATAKEMGYVPNRAARQLRRQRTDTIGYILPADSAGFADPFFSEFIAGLSDEASAYHFDLLVSAASPNSKGEKDLYKRWVQGGKVDGIVVNRVRLNDWRLRFLAKQDIPHVTMERSLSKLNFVGIEVDSFNGMFKLIAHLVERGYKRIAYIGGDPNLKIDLDRLQGYQAGLKSTGIESDPAWIVHDNMTSAGGYHAAELLFALPVPPTALVCINDTTAIGAMHAAHEHGMIVGRDIAIAGFDGIADSAYASPPLTTLDQPIYTIARQLANMILTMALGKTLENKQVKIQPKLLIRSSTGG
ncbi:MAG: LacI family DNA-binding transcriptional regulator [Anaerolineales bacterium]